ncbi:MAG: YigZ family protein [Bacteroidota bacterium]
MTDSYKVLTHTGEAIFRDRGSKFLGFAIPVRSEEEAMTAWAEIQKAHPKCNHHCYAYRIGEGQDRYRANDDGEPNGSAGRPILGQIDSRGLSDVLVVVARYFGGTKLGVPGLINAYKTAASDALDNGQSGIRRLVTPVKISFGYELMSPVMNALNRLEIEMVEQDFAETARIKIELPRSEAADLLRKFKAYVAGVYLEEVGEEFTIDNLEINIC